VPTWAFAVLTTLLLTGPAVAQTAEFSPPPANTDRTATVMVDLAAGAFDRVLPFDVPFFITGQAPAGTVSLEVQYAELPASGDATQLVWMPNQPTRWSPGAPSAVDRTFLVLVRTPLSAGRRYWVRFVFRSAQPGASATFTADGRTGQKNYVSVDAGLLYAGDIGIGALYLGTNIYFRPINKDAPLSEFGSLSRRLALTVGATVSSIADEDNQTRSGLFWNQGLVLGAGYRITSSLRGGGGVLVFRESSSNPLITKKSATTAWYASLSFDLNLLRD